MEATFLQSLNASPNDELTWLALADWLDEDGQSGRAELVRLVRRLRAVPVMRRTKARAALEDRAAALLASGVRPAAPEVVNSVGMRLALVPPGRFRRGSPSSEGQRCEDEGPMGEVEISRAFHLGVFPVTQAHWRAVMDCNPSYFAADAGGIEGRTYADICRPGAGRDEVAGIDTADFPVENVAWGEAVAFCERLSALPAEKKAGRKYRLPTEAEWEYACRGGSASSTPFHLGSSLSASQANINGSRPYRGEKGQALDRTCRVGTYRPNVFGLHDMHGNVFEWCADWLDADYYGDSPPKDPPGPSTGSTRVYRGGSCCHPGGYCRSAFRHGVPPGDSYRDLGFRVAAVTAVDQKAGRK
jgi:uncharacterized protein (TIGR02996 family)